MIRLTKTESALIIITVGAAWFLGALTPAGDWARALGSSVWGLALGFCLVAAINRLRSSA